MNLAVPYTEVIDMNLSLLVTEVMEANLSVPDTEVIDVNLAVLGESSEDGARVGRPCNITNLRFSESKRPDDAATAEGVTDLQSEEGGM